MHELALLFKDCLCNELILTNLGRKQNNPLNCWAITFYILSWKNAEPLPFLIALWVLLSQCFGSYFAESGTGDKKHAWLSESYTLDVSQKRLSAIFSAAHRFRPSNLRLLKTNCNKTQLYDWPLSSPTFYHCVSWQFYSDPSAVTRVCSPPPPPPGGRRAWLCREISGRVDLGWLYVSCVPWSIACHKQQRNWKVGDAPAGHGAAALRPAPAPHSVSNHFHTHRSMKEGQWQTWNLAWNTVEELLSSIHWKLTPYWLTWRSNKAKKKRKGGGTDDGAWAVNQTRNPVWGEMAITGIDMHPKKVVVGGISSSVVLWNEIISTPSQAFVQDTTLLPARQRGKKQNICSFKKCCSPSSAQNVVSGFGLQWKVEENQNKEH